MNKEIIVSESKRSLTQILIASLLFTTAIAVFVKFFVIDGISNFSVEGIIRIVEIIGILVFIGFGFCSVKKVYIDLEQSKFKPAYEIFGFKFGKWKTIYSYEYISIFYTNYSGGTYEVNLWYDTNKHIELYRNEDLETAFIFGYDLSESLNIDLLDATLSESKWVDKEEIRKEMK